MLTPSQIAEMAAVKYPENGSLLYNCLQIDRQGAYIAAFTDAMELMRKEWVPISEPPKKPTMVLTGYWYNDEFLQGMAFYGGITKPYYTHWMPLPEPPKL